MYNQTYEQLFIYLELKFKNDRLYNKMQQILK